MADKWENTDLITANGLIAAKCANTKLVSAKCANAHLIAAKCPNVYST